MALSSNYLENTLGPKLKDNQLYFPKTGEVIGPSPAAPTRTPLSPTLKPGVSALGNLSKQLGGGQYNIAPNPQNLVKDLRGFDTFQERQQVRGPYITDSVGIDHIVPLSLGGTNDATNIQLLPKSEFDKKTVIDNLAALLHRTGHITLGQAREMDLNWNNNPISLLSPDVVKNILNDPKVPDVLNLGGKIYPQKNAIREPVGQVKTPSFWKELINPNNIVTGIKKVLNFGEAAISAPVYGLLEGLTQGKNIGTETKQYFKNVMAGKEGVTNQPAFVEGGKGIISGLTGNWINAAPEQPQNPTDELVGKVAHLGGQAFGMATSMAGLGSLATKAGFIGAKGIAFSEKTLQGSSLARVIKASPTINKMLVGSGLFGAYGQLSRPETAGLEARGKRLLTDLVTGSAFGLLGSAVEGTFPTVSKGKISIPNITAGTLANAFAGYVIAFTEGANEKDALLNAGVFAALHGYGLSENRFALKAEAAKQQSAISFFKQNGTFGEINKNTLSTPAGINKALWDVRDTINIEINEKRLTPKQATPILQRAMVVSRQLYYQTLSLRDRVRMELRDIKSVFEKVQKSNQSNNQTDSSNIEPNIEPNFRILPETRDYIEKLNNINTNPDLANRIAQEAALRLQPLEVNPVVTDRVMSTGMADNINSLANRNQLDFMTYPVEDRSIILARRDLSNDPNAQDPYAVQIIGATSDGVQRHLGWVPKEDNIRNNQNRSPWASDHPLNPAANNVAFAQEMDRLGIKHLKAEPDFTTFPTGIGEASQQPYTIFKVPTENWNAAKILHTSNIGEPSKFTSMPKTREEFFAEIPQNHRKIIVDTWLQNLEEAVNAGDTKRFVDQLNEAGVVVKPQQETVLKDTLKNQTYGSLIDLLGSAADSKTALNEYGQSLVRELANFLVDFRQKNGNEGLTQFLNTPIINAKQTTVVPNVEAVPNQANITLANLQTPQEPSPQSEIPKSVQELEFKSAPKLQPSDNRTNIIVNQAVKTGVQPIIKEDYKTFDSDGNFTALSKRASNKIIELLDSGAERNDPKIQDLVKFQQSLRRENIRASAKRAENFDEFANNYIGKADNLGFEPFDKSKSQTAFGKVLGRNDLYVKYDEDQLQAMKLLYLRSIQAQGTEKSLSIDWETGKTKITDTPTNDVKSNAQERIDNWNSQNGNNDLYTVRLGKKRGDVDLGGPVAAVMDKLNEVYKKEGLLFMVDQNGDIKNSMAVNIKDKNGNYTKTYKELVSRVPDDGGKYLPADSKIREEMMKNRKEVLGKEGPLTDEEKFMLAFNRDVLQVGDNFQPADYMKRINLIDDRSIKYPRPSQGRLIVLPGTKMIDLVKAFPDNFPDYVKQYAADFEKNPADSSNPMKGLFERTREDGAEFMLPNDLQQIRFDMGNSGQSFNLKGTIAHRSANGTLVLNKGNISTLHPDLQTQIEEKYNIKIQPGDRVTFMDNIKNGKEALLPLTGEVKMLPISNEDMHFLFENPKNSQEATFSAQLLGLFSSKDNINNQLVSMFGPTRDKFMEAYRRIMENGETPLKVFKEVLGKDLAAKAWNDKLKDIVTTNGDPISLKKQVENNLIKYFQDNVMRNRDIEGAYLKLSPDMGFYDPAINSTRLLAPNEVMISRRLANQLGIFKTGTGDVLTIRYPTTKQLAMSSLKVLIGEDYGIRTLGNDNVILNSFDTFIRKEGDNDGDAIHIFKIIPRDRVTELQTQKKPLDGIPEDVAIQIEMNRQKAGNELGTQGIETNKYPILPATAEGNFYVAQKASMGKQSIGGITNAINMINMAIDNQKPINGFMPVNDWKTQNEAGQLSQEALDSTKSPAFSNRPEEQRTPIYYQFPEAQQDPSLVKKLSQILNNTYLHGLRLVKRSYPDFWANPAQPGAPIGLLSEAALFNQTAKDATVLHPLQELTKPLADLKPIFITSKAIWQSDIEARQVVENKFEKPKFNPKKTSFGSKEFRDEYIKKHTEMINETNQYVPGISKEENRARAVDLRKQFISDIDELYAQYNHEFSAQDKKDISYFLLTSKEGNINFNPKFEIQNNNTGWYVERFDNLILPEYNTAYHEARNKWYVENVLNKKITPVISTDAPVTSPPQEPSLKSRFPGIFDATK